MPLELKFTLPEKLYLRDPQETSYGKKLLTSSVILFEELGFENFTFGKLAKKMSSSEVSIYRYFENKHLLLLYLNCWYWEWVNYLIETKTLNIQDPAEKLKRTIHCIIYASKESELCDYINENKLHTIIMKESSKSYHVHNIDKENKDGLFIPYKNLVGRVASIISELNSEFKYPHTISTTIFEMILNQNYYVDHLPRLSDLKKGKRILEDLEEMTMYLVEKLLQR